MITFFGAPERIRTSDLNIRSVTLYPLSYGRILVKVIDIVNCVNPFVLNNETHDKIRNILMTQSQKGPVKSPPWRLFPSNKENPGSRIRNWIILCHWCDKLSGF